MNVEAACEDATRRVTEFVNRSAAQHQRRMTEMNTATATMPTVRFKKLKALAMAPTYETTGAACFDLRACFHQTDWKLTLEPGMQTLVGIGIAVAVPRGWVMNVVSRSGLALKARVSVTNAPGKVDSDYRAEIGVILRNDGSVPLIIRHGDRIAQAEIVEAPQWAFVEVEELDTTARGDGGFGSTGIN
jgi:dUTP pyrophosphatase